MTMGIREAPPEATEPTGEAERRGCNKCRDFDHRVSETSQLTGRQCYETWKAKDDARRKAEWDAKTPEEKATHEALIKGLRELY